MPKKIELASLSELVTAAADANEAIKNGQDVLEVVVPEMVRRLVEQETASDDVEKEEPPAPEPDPPTTPAKPNGSTEINTWIRLHAEMSSVKVAELISTAPRGTQFDVFGELPTVRIGGILGEKPGKHNTVAHHADGSPIRDLIFQPGSSTGPCGFAGLLFHNSLGGFDGLHFLGVAIRPRQDGDRAAVLFEEHFREDQLQGGFVQFTRCRVWAPTDWKAWGGRGIDKAMITRSSCFAAIDTYFDCTPKEHDIYAHNMQGGFVVKGLTGITRVFDTPLGPVEVGPGRSAISLQERVSDGLESSGNVLISNIRVRRCGSESVQNGDAGTGGSAITIGGHCGFTVIEDVYIDEPMSGGVLSIWAERFEKGPKKGELKGFREPSLPGVSLDGLRWKPGADQRLFGNRRRIKISNTERVVARKVGPDGFADIRDPWNSTHVKLNDSPSSSPLTPERVDWR